MEGTKEKADLQDTTSLAKTITIETNRIQHEVSNLVVVLQHNDLNRAFLVDLEERTQTSIRLWGQEEWYAYIENQSKK